MGRKFEYAPGSHLFWFELSLPVVSRQFRPSMTILAASAAFRRGLGVSAADLLGRRGRRCRRNRVESANSLRCRRQAAPLFNSFAGPLRRTISAYFSRYLEARWSLWITIRRLVGSLALVGNARSDERYTSDISLDVHWRTDPHRPTD